MKKISKMFFLLFLLFGLGLLAETYCTGIMLNAMDAYCEGNYEGATFWMSFYIEYC